MSQIRFRQIARLEKLAPPYLEARRNTQREWYATRVGAAANAAILGFLIHYGNPKIGEPLSCAWERFTSTEVWKEYCDKWEANALEQFRDWQGRFKDTNNGEEVNHRYLRLPFDRDGVYICGPYLRHELIARFSGSTEKEKLQRVFASAPPWLIWFTFADLTAELLGLAVPDLSSVAGFARSKADFDNWFGLPKGAFVTRPWPYGPANVPLARTGLNLLRPETQRPDRRMTPREQKRARANSIKRIDDDWPYLGPPERLGWPFGKELAFLNYWEFGTAIDNDADMDAASDPRGDALHGA
jgi:hypothetical protein